MASNQVKSGGNVGGKKVLRKIEMKVKKEIIEKYERGMRVTDLAAEYNKPSSTISTILKQKVAIKAANVASGVTMLTKQRPQVLEEMEKLLLVWLNEKQLAGDSVSEAVIWEEARMIHYNLRQKYPSSSRESDEFKASREWFERFCKKNGIVRHGEAASSDTAAAAAAAAEAFAKDFAKFVEAKGYVPQQVFNCDQTGLFWKKMPKRTYITQEEMAMPGHKPMKDRLTLLLCANASGDLKIKPLVVYQYENPREFKQHNVYKTRLPVMWRANTKGLVTRSLFLEWLHEAFVPAVREYLSNNHLPERCVLLMDNALAHPPSLVDLMDNEYNFIEVKFLPANTTPLLQPMDQEIIPIFKKLYTKGLFTKCFNVTEETSLTLREFWKYHFNIVHCLSLIDKAWEDVTYWTLNSAWKKLWPECVAERDFERFEPSVVDEIVSMGNSMGLEVDSDDIEELIKDHDEELTADELVALQNEQHKVLTEEQSLGEEDESFRKVLMRRKRHVTLERHLMTVGPPAKLIKKTQETSDSEITEDETFEVEEITRDKTPEGKRPSIVEVDSPSKQ
ncbi:tigger transposable element-derived protein 1-like isoform X2 [Pseudonaja textilis]|uniref:tigger transposable element-derived protein 1-like isoform X2 n=1 Tax=Pseudonaja textilis TaxID=8673 RepID=UPI000EAA93D2|nr:tigger transposable element-derived protein 1-like isoform X2 [Pseudonaja textilis]